MQSMSILPSLGVNLTALLSRLYKDLLETNSISIDGPVSFQIMVHLDIFCHRQGTDGGEDLRQRIFDLEIFAPEFELSGFDLGKIQNVID